MEHKLAGTAGCNADPNVPCFCVKTWCLVLAGVEILIFTVCLAIFLCCGKSLDKQSITISIFFFIGYLIHFVQSLLIYIKPDGSHCTAITARISFISFLPQAIFFFVFIWVIFKLLTVWQVMQKDSSDEQMRSRQKVQTVSRLYYLVWGLLWIAQRLMEIWIVDQQTKDPNYSNRDIETVLVVCNFAQVLMEVVLFVYLICVLCKLDKFLKSFKEQ